MQEGEKLKQPSECLLKVKLYICIMFSTKYAGWWEVNVVLLIKTFLFSFYRLYKKKKPRHFSDSTLPDGEETDAFMIGTCD